MLKNSKDLLRYICNNGIFISLYVVLCLSFGDLSFGYLSGFSFRIAEVLVAILLFDKKYFVGVVLSCLVSNLLNFNAIDVIIGTIQSFISGLILIFIKNKHLSILLSSSVCGIMIGFELIFLGFSSIGYFIILTTAISEFLMLELGYFLFHKIFKVKKIKNFL